MRTIDEIFRNNKINTYGRDVDFILKRAIKEYAQQFIDGANNLLSSEVIDYLEHKEYQEELKEWNKLEELNKIIPDAKTSN